jgi:hypothetical protein
MRDRATARSRVVDHEPVRHLLWRDELPQFTAATTRFAISYAYDLFLFSSSLRCEPSTVDMICDPLHTFSPLFCVQALIFACTNECIFSTLAPRTAACITAASSLHLLVSHHGARSNSLLDLLEGEFDASRSFFASLPLVRLQRILEPHSAATRHWNTHLSSPPVVTRRWTPPSLGRKRTLVTCDEWPLDSTNCARFAEQG